MKEISIKKVQNGHNLDFQLIYQYCQLIENYHEKRDKDYIVPHDFRDLFKKLNEQVI